MYSAIGGKALAENEEGAEALGPLVVATDQKAADIGETVLLAAHGGAIGKGEHLLGDIHEVAVLIALFTLANEVGVLGKPAGVDDEWDSVL